ncbi:MAG TPA: AsmA family protein, partial [Methylophilaceae bacterium]|nr:AsmA family protein [Methylophilaceae bacterium]
MAHSSGRFHIGRLGRYLLFALAAVVIVLIVCEILGWPFLRMPAQRFMSQQLERQVRLDAPFKVHFFGGIKLKLGGLWIAAPSGFDAPYLVDAKNISLALRYSDLLGKDASDPLRIKAIRVNQIDAYLARNKNGDATWQFKKDESKAPAPFPRIETLVVRNGSAVVRDALNEADIKVSFSSQEGTSNAKPVSTVKAEGKFRAHPVSGEIHTNGFLPIASQGEDSPPIASKGWVEYGGVRVDFDGTVSDLFGNRKINAKFQGQGPSLSLVGDLFHIALPTTKAFKLSGDVRKENELLV